MGLASAAAVPVVESDTVSVGDAVGVGATACAFSGCGVSEDPVWAEAYAAVIAEPDAERGGEGDGEAS